MPTPVPSSPAVAVSGLVMRYGEKVAVDDLDLVVDRNTITALRPYLVDLLTATGLELDAARSLLPAD